MIRVLGKNVELFHAGAIVVGNEQPSRCGRIFPRPLGRAICPRGRFFWRRFRAGIVIIRNCRLLFDVRTGCANGRHGWRERTDDTGHRDSDNNDQDEDLPRRTRESLKSIATVL